MKSPILNPSGFVQGLEKALDTNLLEPNPSVLHCDLDASVDLVSMRADR
jgi:hypothetical protein